MFAITVLSLIITATPTITSVFASSPSSTSYMNSSLSHEGPEDSISTFKITEIKNL
jgi:hypothetical protein